MSPTRLDWWSDVFAPPEKDRLFVGKIHGHKARDRSEFTGAA